MRRKQGMKWLVLSILWIGIILLFSSQNGTTSHGFSQTFIETAGKIFFPDFEQWTGREQSEWIEGIEPLIRKMAHFLEYGFLGILASLAVKGILSAAGKYTSKMKCGLFVFYPCMMISCADEILQISSGGRTTTPADVVLDCAGVIAGIIFCLSHQSADVNGKNGKKFRPHHRRK